MNIVDDDDTTTIMWRNSFLKSNLNNKNGRDKMIKNTFLKILEDIIFRNGIIILFL